MRKMASGKALFNSRPFLLGCRRMSLAQVGIAPFHKYLAPSSLGAILLFCTFLRNHQLKAQSAKEFSACFLPKRIFVFPIDQARREADAVYNLAVHANVTAFESKGQREREHLFLLGYLSAEMRGKATKDRIQTLRLVVQKFLESVIILDTAIAQVVAERLSGQTVLFRDCSVKLEEQLQMAERASEYFNLLARSAGTAEIELGELRKSLQPETDRQISIWVSLARLETLSTFGNLEDVHAAMDRLFLLCEHKSDEGSA